MAKVTDVDYYLPELLLEKLDLMCKRVSGTKKLQNVFGCDGEEGFGKSTVTAACAYYMSHKLKRPLYLFFDIESLIKHALTHEDCIYIWDDAAYSALSIQAYNSLIIKFIKTIFLARKKRHTYFINIQDIFRLKELLVSRMLGLIHVYSHDELTIGRFTYYKKDALRIMYDVWMRQRRKQYKKYSSFTRQFPNVLYKIFDETEYESLKDLALLSIPDDSKSKGGAYVQKFREFRKTTANAFRKKGVHDEEIAKIYGVQPRVVRDWRKEEVGEDGEGGQSTSSSSYCNRLYIQPITTYYKTYIQKQPLEKPQLLKQPLQYI
jgi:hypothetical protein